MNQGNFTLEVLVNGRSIREYQHEGRFFIEGREQTQYSLRVKNNSWRRVLALVSIDGLGVFTGKIASLSDPGYVIEPWSSVEIKGFRENNNSVGSFLFTNRDASYAAGQGIPLNAGVIGAIIVEEKPQPVVAPVAYRVPNFREQDYHWVTGCLLSGCSSGPQGPAGNISADWMAMEQERSIAPRRKSEGVYMCSTVKVEQPVAKTFDLGTTWGKRVNDRVRTVTFERGVTAAQLDLYYASRHSLEALGIRFYEEVPVAFPQSFPTYAKPPAGWRG